MTASLVSAGKRRYQQALLAVGVYLIFALAGIVRQSVLLADLQAPRMHAIEGMLLDEIHQTLSMDSRSPLANLVSEIWLSGQEIAWLRVNLDDGKGPITRGDGSLYEALPKTWQQSCQSSQQFQMRSELGHSTVMAGAPATAAKDPGFCVFIGYKSDVAAQSFFSILRTAWLILAIGAVSVFLSWRFANPASRKFMLVFAVLLTTLLCHIAVKHVVADQVEAEMAKTAKLAMVDFKIALATSPITALKDKSIVSKSLQDILRWDSMPVGIGIELGRDFAFWQWRGQPDASNNIARSALSDREGKAVGNIAVAFPQEIYKLTLLHSLTLIGLLSAAAWAMALFMDEFHAVGARLDADASISPTAVAAFFVILTEELLRPTLLLQLQQQVSGLPLETTTWLGVNAFWVCALWGTWTSYQWLRRFCPSRILMWASLAVALTLFGQALVHAASIWLVCRGVEGYAFGIAFQSGLLIAIQMKNEHSRLSAFGKLAQAALIATVIGPLIGGALARVAGATVCFLAAAVSATAAAWFACRIERKQPFRNATSVLSMVQKQGTRALALPLYAMGVANRFAWFTAAGLFLPVVGASQPLGTAATGEMIGALGIGMFVGRRLIDRHRTNVSHSHGWACNLAAAFLMGTGFLFNASVWMWIPLSFVAGMLLTVGSRAQQDWITAQPVQHAAGLQGISRLADRSGALLAGIFIAPTLTLTPSVPSFSLLLTVTLLWIFSNAYFAQPSSV